MFMLMLLLTNPTQGLRTEVLSGGEVSYSDSFHEIVGSEDAKVAEPEPDSPRWSQAGEDDEDEVEVDEGDQEEADEDGFAVTEDRLWTPSVLW